MSGFLVRLTRSLNESPSEKEGKFSTFYRVQDKLLSLNESPSEKEGKFVDVETFRKEFSLNESPSEKEGKLNDQAAEDTGRPGPQ